MDLPLQDISSVALWTRMDHDTFISACSGDEDDNSSIASNAFAAVKSHFEQNSSISDQEKQLIAASNRIEDVQQVVAGLIAKYESKNNSSKTRKWLQKTSDTICHYGTVLDVFVQHHPEYVSLVWGTFKLLFSSVVNHAETLKLLAKSTSQIATRLPRIRALSKLYATKQMRLAVESLYSCILEFLLTTHSWVNESKLRHFYHSFTRPHKLRYDDLLGRITDCSNDIIELATLGSQTEIRVMHTSQTSKLDDILSTLDAEDKARQNQLEGLAHLVSRLTMSDRRQERKLDLIISLLKASGLTIDELLTKAEAIHSLQTSALLDTDQQLSRPQLTEILSTLSTSFEDPQISYAHHLFLRNRRASGMGVNTSTNTFWLSPKLTQWSSSRESSVAIIKGPFSSRRAILDFGASIIQTLSSSGIPTVWALPSAEKLESNAGILTSTDLMRYLTYQALLLSSQGCAATIQTEKQIALRHSQFRTANTLKDWLNLFKQAVASLPGKWVYLVADLATVRSDLGPGTADEFAFFQELNRMLTPGNHDTSIGGTKNVKVMFLLYEANWFNRLPDEVAGHVVSVKVTSSKRRRQLTEMQQAVNARVFPCFRGIRGRRRKVA
ncbi:hypothetical protein C7999DRAFT_29042 [Corynascus novoguineensis]|uniref:DUF7708 domain-containing protein n=1 Tax=Corynascus novoguineensis TaxID=1126955 RepID=A0AAN7HT59_9PEZI|nr:hypothetical protein C7999DRAFT_29042 [Corynascus novoguineensis]